MKYFILINFLLFTACQSAENHFSKDTGNTAKPIDTSKYTILKYNAKEDSSLFNGNYRSADLSRDEIDKIEKIIKIRVDEYNKQEKLKSVQWNKQRDKKMFPNEVDYAYTIVDVEKYFKQFITVTNSKGEKEVWANCFCDKNVVLAFWKKQKVRVMDGGQCFFRVKINLSKNIAYDFSVNGRA